MDPLLKHFTADRDVECPRCAYNLRNAVTDVCPECGLRLELSVGIGTPDFGLLLLTLTPAVAYCGFWGLIVTGLSFALLFARPGGSGGPPLFAYLLFLLGLADLVLILALYSRRRRFIGLPRATQLAAAAVVWLGHLAVTLVVWWTMKK